MLANVDVSEPKPPVDPDSSLSYTMEGYRGLPPSTMIPFFWSPGWNSVQSINKYQQEVGGPLRDGDPGVRLFEPVQNGQFTFFMSEPETFAPAEGKLRMVYLYHIFGSEELSSHAPGIAERSPKAYIMLHASDANKLHLSENQLLAFEVDGQPYRLPVKINPKMPEGVAGLPYGLQGLPYVELPAWGILKKD
jgi:NADH-quinone oxidoreductase subunit G